ncbi:hypothetical protein OESDEN_20493 [Oesophagostomum dentatum]|uniref:Uncharacterized protein n=1 Tax=Oesophagostomum dentatum TaxID=61180 RepID=A0A0B1S8H9_OESDE|nr:hypothetical protein OESDEN_20493 [Oesophagostomum dentatum]
MQLTSGIVTESGAMPSCAPAVVYCSYDSASPSTITPPSSMEKQQRPDDFCAADCVRQAAADHILEYSASSSSTVSTSDALQVAREQLRKRKLEGSLVGLLDMAHSLCKKLMSGQYFTSATVFALVQVTSYVVSIFLALPEFLQKSSFFG